MIDCPGCGKELEEPEDTTYSNIKTSRAEIGQHTGDIYYCEKCEVWWLDDFLDNEVRIWNW